MQPIRAASILLLLAASPVAAQNPPPPPPELKELMERGGVTFDFYDPAKRQMERPARTRFTLSCNWNFRVMPDSRMQGKRVRLTLKPFDVQVTSQIQQTMTLPQSLVDDTFWKRSLVLHEFDHVTIAADPRPRRLIQHLALKMRVIERTLEPGQKPSDTLNTQIVNDELNARRAAVTDLINRNHALLDAKSDHGNVVLPARPKFFQDLYTKANLTAMEFPYLSECLDLLGTKEYSQPEPVRPKR